MNINDYDYKFAYTVGAYCDLMDLHLAPTAKTRSEQYKTIMQMAVIMSKAYEDREALNSSEYKVNYLTMPLLRSQSIQRIVDELAPEVNAAVAEGAFRTVEAEPPKKGAGTAQ